MLFASMGHAALSQDLIADATNDFESGTVEQFTESINIISKSGKIFILSNANQQMSMGDFVTLSLREQGPVARAVVGKKHKDQVGIKVLKVYSLSRWGRLARGVNVDILRGDDAVLFRPKKKKKNSDELNADKILSEEDLFNEKAIVEEELGGFQTDSRHIKPDNVVSIAYSQFSFVDDISGDRLVNNQFNYSWAFQFADNYWVEGLYGRAEARDFPRTSELTIINNFTVRLKYTLKAPLYSYLIPYIGFQTFSVSSPNAGIPLDASDPTEVARANQEKQIIDELEKTGVVLGVTLLRRLVPGWFLKVDLGNDIFGAGFAIEF